MLSSFQYKEVDISEEVRRIVAQNNRFTIYYGLYDIEKRYADHIAQVEKSDSGFVYQISRHGIGHKMQELADDEMLLRRILVDNSFFNLTEQIHLELEPAP
jgi:hypothetical protein